MREAAMSDHHTRPDDRAGLATPARRRSMPPSPGAGWTGTVARLSLAGGFYVAFALTLLVFRAI
jgi:hypothetical protein